MDTTSFQQNWEQKKSELKKEYPQLEERDLEYEIGKEEELLQRLQEKLGKTKADIRNWLHIMG